LCLGEAFIKFFLIQNQLKRAGLHEQSSKKEKKHHQKKKKKKAELETFSLQPFSRGKQKRNKLSQVHFS